MTVPPANLPRPGGIIASWSGTAYSTRQVWLISQLTSISEGLSPIRHPGTRLVGDGRPTTELEVAYSRTAVQGLRFRCYSWARGYHSWTREPRHPVNVTDVYATESRTPLVRELSADHFSVGLLLHCSPPTQGQSGGMGKGVWRPGSAVLSSQCGKTFSSDYSQLVIAMA